MPPTDTTPAYLSADIQANPSKSGKTCQGSLLPAASQVYRALLIDDDAHHAGQLVALLQRQSFMAERVRSLEEATARLRCRTQRYELVIVNVSDNSFPWCRALQKLQDACRQWNGRPAPLFLCVSKSQKCPDFVLQIEGTGARYVFEG